MSKQDFTTEEFQRRRHLVREAMEAAGIDWLIAIHPVSIHWLTGSDAKSYQEFQCLLVPGGDGPLNILTRQGEVDEFMADALVDDVIGWGGGIVENPIDCFSTLADRLGLKTARVGIEVPAYYLHPYHYEGIKSALGDALVADASNLIHDLKLVKSPAELHYIRKAAAIADEAVNTFLTEVSVGRTELSLAGRVYESLMDRGSGLAASPMNIVSGERSCFSHGAPTERMLKRGDSVNIELGAAYRRYTATIGRQCSLGAPSTRLQHIYDVVRAAADACIAAVRDGVAATVPHEAACEVIDDAGLSAYRVHTTGYGLAPGFPPSWGEPLHLLDKSDYVLRAGMVITVEPPVFVGREQLGARIIDNVLVTVEGAELLSSTDRDLAVIE